MEATIESAIVEDKRPTRERLRDLLDACIRLTQQKRTGVLARAMANVAITHIADGNLALVRNCLQFAADCKKADETKTGLQRAMTMALDLIMARRATPEFVAATFAPFEPVLRGTEPKLATALSATSTTVAAAPESKKPPTVVLLDSMIGTFENALTLATAPNASSARKGLAMAHAHELAVTCYHIAESHAQWPVFPTFKPLTDCLVRRSAARESSSSSSSSSASSGPSTSPTLELVRELRTWAGLNRRTPVVRAALMLATYITLHEPSATVQSSQATGTCPGDAHIKHALAWAASHEASYRVRLPILRTDERTELKLEIPSAAALPKPVAEMQRTWAAGETTAQLTFDCHNLMRHQWKDTWQVALVRAGFPATSLADRDQVNYHKPWTVAKGNGHGHGQGQTQATDNKERLTAFHDLVLTGKVPHNVQHDLADEGLTQAIGENENRLHWPARLLTVQPWTMQTIWPAKSSTVALISAANNGTSTSSTARKNGRKRPLENSDDVQRPASKWPKTTETKQRGDGVASERGSHRLVIGPIRLGSGKWIASDARLGVTLFLNRRAALTEAFRAIESCAGWTVGFTLHVTSRATTTTTTSTTSTTTAPPNKKPTEELWLCQDLPPTTDESKWLVYDSHELTSTTKEADLHVGHKKHNVPDRKSMGLTCLADWSMADWKQAPTQLVVDVVVLLVARAVACDTSLGNSGLGCIWLMGRGSSAPGVLFCTEIHRERNGGLPTLTSTTSVPNAIAALCTSAPAADIAIAMAGAIATSDGAKRIGAAMTRLAKAMQLTGPRAALFATLTKIMGAAP